MLFKVRAVKEAMSVMETLNFDDLRHYYFEKYPNIYPEKKGRAKFSITHVHTRTNDEFCGKGRKNRGVCLCVLVGETKKNKQKQ